MQVETNVVDVVDAADFDDAYAEWAMPESLDLDDECDPEVLTSVDLTDEEMDQQYAEWRAVFDHPHSYANANADEIDAMRLDAAKRIDEICEMLVASVIAKAKGVDRSKLLATHLTYLRNLGCNMFSPLLNEVHSLSEDVVRLSANGCEIMMRIEQDEHSVQSWSGHHYVSGECCSSDPVFVTYDPLYALAVSSNGTFSVAIHGLGYSWHGEKPDENNPFDSALVKIDPAISSMLDNKDVVFGSDVGSTHALLPHAIRFHVKTKSISWANVLEQHLPDVLSSREELPVAYDKVLYASDKEFGNLHYLYPLHYPANDILIPRVLKEEIQYGAKKAELVIVQRPLMGVPLARSQCTVVTKDGGHLIEMSRAGDAGGVVEIMEGVTSTAAHVTWTQQAQDFKVESMIHRGFTDVDQAGLQTWRQFLAAQKSSPQHKVKFGTANKGWYGVKTASGEIVFPAGYILESKVINLNGTERVIPLGQSTREMTTAGTLDGWCEIILPLLYNGNSSALLGFASSSLLLSFISDAEPGIIQLLGESGSGKTSTQQHIASTFTGPFKSGHPASGIASFRTTENGLEGIVHAKNNACLLLDEIGSAGANTDWSSLGYMLANGVGKSRMNADSSMRQTKTWLSQIVSTGEESFMGKIVATGKAERGGLLFRIVDVNVANAKFFADIEREIQGGTQGRYTEVCRKYAPDAKSVSDVLEGILKGLVKNHGHMWMRMAERLLDESVRSKAVHVYQNAFGRYEKMLGATTSRILHRRIKHLASSMAGLDLLLHSMPNVTDTHKAEILDVADEWLREHLWRAGLPEDFGTESDQIVGQFMEHLNANPQRIYIHGKQHQHGPFWGWIDKKGRVCLSKMGFDEFCKLAKQDPQRILPILMSLPDGDAWEHTTSRDGTGSVGKKCVRRVYRSPAEFVAKLGYSFSS